MKKFLINWCGEEQIYRIDEYYFICEMGCSGGIAPEDTMSELYEQLIKLKFKLQKDSMVAYLLEEGISIEEK